MSAVGSGLPLSSRCRPQMWTARGRWSITYPFEHPAVEGAAALAASKADTFSESFAAANDPAQLAAHLARAFPVDAVSAQLVDPRCDTTWVLDDGKPVGYLKVNCGTAQTVPEL